MTITGVADWLDTDCGGGLPLYALDVRDIWIGGGLIGWGRVLLEVGRRERPLPERDAVGELLPRFYGDRSTSGHLPAIRPAL